MFHRQWGMRNPKARRGEEKTVMSQGTERDRPDQTLPANGKHPAGPGRRGPRTSAGKARVRLNAVRHGLGVASPVIPGMENPEDWEAHRAAMLASLRPVGHLEMALAEHAALAQWRLNRVTRYEVACVVAKGPPEAMIADVDRLMPYPEETDRIIRYEAHLSRQFYQALHELEAQQARRQGQAAPLARVDVQGLPEAQPERMR
jgi:hypothetical protein